MGRLARTTVIAAVATHAFAQNRPFNMHIIPQATADMFGAKCLDGSPPGFYWRPAANGNVINKWKIHFRGGGWCYSVADCYSRFHSESGGSSYYIPNAYESGEAVYGLMDDNGTEYGNTNPFGDWNSVWAPYCDGSSWLGDHEDPFVYNNTQVWIRGWRNLLAIIHELEVLGGFTSNATEVIITGTSAGGLATALHSSYIKSQLQQPNNKLVAVPDAGWWWDAPNVNGQHAFAAGFINAYGPSFWNATARALPAACLASKAPSDQWQCTLTDSSYATGLAAVDGVFVMQSLYDSAQLGMELQLPCNPYSNCNATQLQMMQDYRTLFQGRIQDGQAVYGNRDGHFFTACYQHEESCRDFDWFGIKVTAPNGQVLNANSTFYNWYYNTGGPTRVVDGVWPNNPTCQPQGVKHGGC